ncbi:MAG: hypothetical protein GC178_07165 [Flavobacteriales bacterium]|nr:hypothetical protein [Flavobacteriales bacterium]
MRIFKKSLPTRSYQSDFDANFKSSCFRWGHLFFVLAKIPPYAHGKGEFSRPYNSTNGVPESVGLMILIACIVFFGYVAFRVNKGLKKKPSKKIQKHRKKNLRN